MIYNPMDLTGKRILITGASSGIGRACAVMASKLGANCVLVARRQAQLEDTLTLMQGKEHFVLPFDLSVVQSIVTITEKYDFKKNKIDGVIHAAGIMGIVPLSALQHSAATEMMNINFLSYIELSRILSKKFYSNDKASFVAISSTASRVGWKGGVAYCASKAALDVATRVMALELAHRRIRFNSVLPSYIKTDIIEQTSSDGVAIDEIIKQKQPLGIGYPDDVSHAVCFLLSNAASFITGTNMVVDGGYLAQ